MNKQQDDTRPTVPRRTSRSALTLLPLLGLLITLPLAGVGARGQPLTPYLHFPPRTSPGVHAEFSPPIFWALAAILALGLLPLLHRGITAPRSATAGWPTARSFPWWGWAGVFLTFIAWALAWSRFAWLAPWQPLTFSPLWCGYIVGINALTLRRTGHCLLIDRPGLLLRLSGTSAAFWWLFEYLNQFVANWHYSGIEALTSWQYVFFATLSFATVLPAVLGTHEFLCSFPGIGAGLDDYFRIRVQRPRLAAGMVLLLAAAGLAGLGIWPDFLFALLWASPLLILVSLQVLRRQRTIFAPLAEGHWRRLCLAALAALICGLCWEMWNYYSLAKWTYTVPFVDRFHLFEMPILGYAGYLPFGLECLAVADLLRDQPPRDIKEHAASMA